MPTWRPTTARAAPQPQHEGQDALRGLQGRDPEETPARRKPAGKEVKTAASI